MPFFIFVSVISLSLLSIHEYFAPVIFINSVNALVSNAVFDGTFDFHSFPFIFYASSIMFHRKRYALSFTCSYF